MLAENKMDKQTLLTFELLVGAKVEISLSLDDFPTTEDKFLLCFIPG